MTEQENRENLPDIKLLISGLSGNFKNHYRKTDIKNDFPVRLFNGRNPKIHGFDFISADLYPPLLFIIIYRKLPEEYLKELTEKLISSFPDNQVLIQDRSSRPFRLVRTEGDIPEEIIITETGLKYLIHPFRGQNPGFFPDMREGRKLVKELVKACENPCRVLNLFSYTCAFSVTALSAGAEKVVNIDMNRRSLDIGKRNHRLNHESIPGGYRNQASFLSHDIFKSFGKLRKEGPYSLIIADPPPSQKGSFNLDRDYPKLLKRLPDMLTTDGSLLLTYNGPNRTWEEFEEMARTSLGNMIFTGRIEPPEDFASAEPGLGLKILLLKKPD